MSLLEKLKRGTDNKKTIPFPGTSENIVLRVLSDGARQDARFATEHRFKANNIDVNMMTADTYEAENSLQLLYRALSDMDGNPLARTVDDFRTLINLEEKNILIVAYLEYEAECSPSPQTMTAKELEALLEEIKKKPQTIGSLSSMPIARQLISYLANRPATSLTDSGSIS